jgi:hypothetical protein
LVVKPPRERPILLVSPLFCPGGVLVYLHARGVQRHILQVGVDVQIPENLHKSSTVDQLAEAGIDRFPRVEALRQVAPRGTAAGDPEDGVDDWTGGGGLPGVPGFFSGKYFALKLTGVKIQFPHGNLVLQKPKTGYPLD